LLAVLAAYFYSTMHYLVTPCVLIWMYRRHPGEYRFARTTLALSTVLALVGFHLVPTVPPRLLDGSGIRDSLADVSRWGWWGGEGSVPRGLGSLSNQFAAMPSLHVGWAIWCGVLIALYAERRWVKVLGIAYPIATSVVVMATGNHYLLDAVAGAITMAAGALLASALPKPSPMADVVADSQAAANGFLPADADADADATDVRSFPGRPVPLPRASNDQFCRPSR
jgi:hypothetical protein